MDAVGAGAAAGALSVASSSFVVDDALAEDVAETLRAGGWRVEGGPGRWHVQPAGPQGWATLDAVEQRHVARVLSDCGGDEPRAAAILGVDRKTLSRRLERYRALGGPEWSSR